MATSFPEPTTFNGPDTRELGRSNGQPTPWHCTVCEAHGRGVMAQADHWRLTQHMCRFGKRPDCYATFAHMQPDFKGGEFRMYQVHGGERDKSTLSEATVRALGIRIREDGR